jgi:hypothetical protein
VRVAMVRSTTFLDSLTHRRTTCASPSWPLHCS